MKNRAFHGAGEGDDGGSRRRNHKKNRQRLGGSGLSLEAFANAKSRASGYNPALIKKQREFYRNAKYVSKFKKSMKRESQSEDQHPLASRLEDVDVNENEAKPLKCKNKNSLQTTRECKKKNSLQTTREEYEKRQAELEKAKLEREAIIQAKKEERAKAESRRKALRESMFKKTRSGQPVMKYRIGHLLEGLLQNPTG